MAKKVVIKVTIKSDKEKRSILKAVAKLGGINEVSMDAEKGTLTIIGDADPVCIISSLRKKCLCAEIDSVGPPKKEEKKEEKKDEKPKDPPPCLIRPCPPCPPCPYPYSYCCEYEANPCSIL